MKNYADRGACYQPIKIQTKRDSSNNSYRPLSFVFAFLAMFLGSNLPTDFFFAKRVKCSAIFACSTNRDVNLDPELFCACRGKRSRALGNPRARLSLIGFSKKQ